MVFTEVFYSKVFVLNISILLSLHCYVDGQALIDTISPCKCKFQDGSIIDLSPLASSGGEPRWKDLEKDQNGYVYKYSYNPCNPFTEPNTGGSGGDLCHDVAACQIDEYQGNYNLGKQDAAEFIIVIKSLTGMQEKADQDGIIAIRYTKPGEDPDYSERITQVELECTQGEDKLEPFGDVDIPYTYVFKLSSPHACPKGSGGLSAGSILLIIFFALLCVYIVGGVLFQKFARGASGKDLIPNKDIWFSLCGLVKDGGTMVVSTVKGGASDTAPRNKSNYEEM